MFKIIPNPEFTAPVKLTVPGQDAPAVVDITFRHQSSAAVAEWLKQAASQHDVDTLSAVIVGWSGVGDGEGQPVEYSRESLSVLLDNYPAAGAEFLRAYLAALSESRVKN
jgi:hypothetical protein